MSRIRTVSNRNWLFLASAVLLLAAGLRFYEITRWSLSNDEIAEVRWASRSFPGMMSEVRRDAVHPPLDYLIQFVVSHAPGPEWLHRVPAALFGLGTIFMVMLLGRMWFGDVAGIAAGLFAALAPMHVRFSQEVRPYSLALLMICASLVALELYARNHDRRWAIAWFVLVLLSGASLYFAGMVAGAASVFRIFGGRRDTLAPLWKRLPLIFVAWVVLYAPWFPVIFHVAHSRSPQPADKLTWDWWQLRIQTFATGDWRFEPVSLGSWAFWLVVLIGIAASLRGAAARTAVFWFIAGTALQIIALQLRPHFTNPRYLMSSWPAAFLLAGAGVATLWRRWAGRAIAVMVVAAFAGYAAITLQTYYRGERSDWRGIAEFVHTRAKSGETVIAANPWVLRNFGYYWVRLPRRDDVQLIPFGISDAAWQGPVWVVTGQCMPRRALKGADRIAHNSMTEEAYVFYVRPGDVLPMNEELCPE